MMILMLLTACALLYGTSRLFTQKALVLAMARCVGEWLWQYLWSAYGSRQTGCSEAINHPHCL